MKKKSWAYAVATGVLAVIGAVDTATAATITELSQNVVSNAFVGANQLVTAGSYVLGVAFGVKAALKLKEHNESDGRTKLSAPITLGVVSALLLGLPSFLKSGIDTTFGSGAGTTTQQGTVINP